jgi:F0F1-type ATP synthase assembly protein I
VLIYQLQHITSKKAVILHQIIPMATTPENEKKDGGVKPYMKYSGLAFQMIAVMVLAAWGGMKLDEHFATQNPWFTIGLMVVAVVASMVLVILSLNKK